MIRRLRGTIIETGINFMVVEVNNIGYLVYTNAAADINAPVELYTYLAVRENALDLYGFTKETELYVFQSLIDLPKIGPKTALQILCQADVSLIKESVRNNDPAYLSKMSGIGKKSAEKIVAGLKDKFETDEYEENYSQSPNREQIYTADTIDALLALGYPQADARKVAQQIANENPEIKSSADALKLALKLLSQ